MASEESFVGKWIKLIFTPVSDNPDRLLMPRTMTGYCHEPGEGDNIHFQNAGIESLKMCISRSLLDNIEVIPGPAPA